MWGNTRAVAARGAIVYFPKPSPGSGGGREAEIHPGEKGIAGSRVHAPPGAHEQVAQTALILGAREIGVRPKLRHIHPQQPVAAKGKVHPAHERIDPAAVRAGQYSGWKAGTRPTMAVGSVPCAAAILDSRCACSCCSGVSTCGPSRLNSRRFRVSSSGAVAGWSVSIGASASGSLVGASCPYAGASAPGSSAEQRSRRTERDFLYFATAATSLRPVFPHP